MLDEGDAIDKYYEDRREEESEAQVLLRTSFLEGRPGTLTLYREQGWDMRRGRLKDSLFVWQEGAFESNFLGFHVNKVGSYYVILGTERVLGQVILDKPH